MDVTPPATCHIVLKIEANGYADRVLIARLPILKANDTAWEDYVLGNDGFYAGDTLAAQSVSSTDPASPELEYTSADESVCTVDEGTGEITAVAAGECSITLTARAQDYLDKIIDKSLTISAFKQFTDIVWNFPETAIVGVDTPAIDAPVVKDADGNDVTDSNLAVTVAQKSGDCAWDGSARTVSFSGTTECIVEVSASGVRGYAGYSKEFEVTPGEGDMGLTWDGYGNNNVATFGTDAPALEDPATVPADLEAEYSYAASGGGCEVDAATGALTLLGADQSCDVTLTGVVAGYVDGSVEVTVTINKGAQTLSVTNPYGSAASVGNGETLEIVNAPTGGRGGLYYRTDSANCTVHPTGGALTAGAATGDCVVQAKWAGDRNYNPSPDTTIATVPMKASGNVAPAWSTTPYGSAPTVGGSAVAMGAGAITNAGNGNPEYNSKTPDICGVDASSGALSGLAAGTCTLRARFSGDTTKGASAWTDSPEITVEKGTHPALAPDAYGASASVRVGETLELATAPVGYGDATYTTTTDTVCSVDKAGVITALAVGDCTIQVAFAGDENYNGLAAGNLQTVTVSMGGQVIVISEPYGEEPTLVVGDSLSIVNAPTVTAGGQPGGELTYRKKSGQGWDTCNIAADGAITTNIPSGTVLGPCRVEVQAAAVPPNWAASEWVEVAVIPVEKATFAGISWTPAVRRMRIGEELTLEPVDAGSSGANISYRVSDAGESGCAFKAADQNDANAVRTLTATNQGRCVVMARGSRAHFHQWSQEHTVLVGLGTFEVDPGVWGEFPSGVLVLGGESMTPVPTETAPDGVSISYQLLRGERECRLVDHRTGEVEALPVPLQRDESAAEYTFSGTVSIDVVTFTAKETGAGGDAITVTIEDGGTSDKKYTITDGNNPETYDNVAIADVITAMADSALVDVAVLDTNGEPANVSATALSGGADGVASAGTFSRGESVEVVTFAAKDAGIDGNAITVTIQDGTYTITGGTTVETYENVAIADLSAALSDSALVGATLVDITSDNEPDNIGATTLQGGTSAIVSKCSIQGLAEKPGYRRAKSDPIEIALQPGNIPLASLPRYEGMRVNPDETVQLTVGESLSLEVNGELTAVGGFSMDFVYSSEGYDSAGDAKSDVCVVDAATGEITAGSAAIGGDVCRLIVHAADTRDIYADTRFTLDFVLEGGDQLDFTSGAPVLSYGDGAKLKLGDANPRTPTGLPTEDEASPAVDVAWKYVLTGLASDGSTEKEDICRVDERWEILNAQNTMVANPDYGVITIGEGDIVRGDICRIQAYGTAPGYQWYEGVAAVDLTVEGRDLLFAKPGTKPAFPNALRIGGDAAPDTTATADDNRIAVTWSDWRVVGDDADGSDATDGDVCSIDTATGVVRPNGSAASAGDTCAVYATATPTTDGDYYETKENVLMASYTIGATGTFANLTGPVYDADGLLAGGDPLAYTTAPSGDATDRTTAWAYSAVGKRGGNATDDICTVDAATGTITLGSAAEIEDTCEITATASANGYTSKAAPVVTLTVKTTFDSLAWTGFPSAGQVGTPVDLSSNPPVSVPAADTYTITVASGDCAWNTNTDTLTFTDIGTCEVKVVASKAGYAHIEDTYSVTPTAGVIAVTGWGNYGTVTVGADTAAATLTGLTPAGAGKAYALADDSSGCTVTSSGVVTGTAVSAACKVTLSLTHTGYTGIDHTYTLSVGAGTIAVAGGDAAAKWGTYPTVRLNGDTAAPNLGALTPSDASKAYATDTGSAGCTVTPAGVVTGTAVGSSNCKIKVTLSKTHYNDLTYTYTFSVEKGLLTLAGNTNGDKWGQYGTVAVGAALVEPPAYNVAESGITAAYTSLTQTVCTVTGSGQVRGLSAASCSIKLVLSKTDYVDATYTYIFNVRKGTLPITWGNFGSNTLKVGGSTQTPGTAAITGISDATIAYALKVGESDCTLVTAGTGEVRAVAVDLTGGTVSCTIVGTASKDGYDTATSGDISINLSPGTLPAITWGTFSGTLEVAGAAKAPGSATGGGGATFSYALKAGSGTNCELLNTGTGRVRAKVVATTPTKTCTVVGTAAKTGYTTETREISVNLSPGDMGTLTAPTYGGSLAIEGTLSITGAPSGAPNGAGWSYSVAGERNSNTQTGICNIISDTGVVSTTSSAQVNDVCIVTATATATGYSDKSVTRRLTVTAKTPLTITWAGYTPASLTWASGGITAPTTSAPSFAAGGNTVTSGIGHSFAVGSGTTNNSCSVNTSNGALTINGAGICKITLTVRDTNSGDATSYAENSKTVTVTINKATQSLTISNTYGASAALNVGESALAVENAPTGGQSSLNLQYRSQTTAVCTVAASGAVSPVTTGTCTVQVQRAGNANFEASGWEEVLSIAIGLGTLGDITWGSFTGTLKVGGATKTPTAPSGAGTTGATISYALKTGESDCTLVDDTSGEVRAREVDLTSTQDCVIVGTASRTGYNSKTGEISIDLAAGTITAASWGSYPAVVVGRATGSAPTLGQVTPQGAIKTYTSGDTDACTVGESNGRVTGVTSGNSNCAITLTLSATGYTSLSHTYTLSVGLGSQSAPGSWNNAYGSATPSVGVGATVEVGNGEPNNSAPGGGALEYAIKSGGSHCALTGSTVRGKLAGSGAECAIHARWAAVADKYPESGWTDVATITVNTGVQAAPGSHTGGTPYGANPTVAVNGTLAIGSVTVPVNGANPVGGALKYLSKTEAVCTVDATSGLVTGVTGGDCEIVAVFKAVTDKYTESPEGAVATITVTKLANSGTISSADHYVNTVTLGSPITPKTGRPLPSNGEGGLGFRIWDQADPTGGAGSDDCTILQNNGEVTGASGSVGDTCFVHARWKGSATHAASDWFNISGTDGITVAGGSQTYTWSQTDATATFGTDEVLADLTGLPAGAANTFEILTSGNTAGCAWKGNTGTNARTLTFTGAGSCQVRLRVTRTNYDDWVSGAVTITVNLASWGSVSWTGYSGTATYGSTAPTLVDPDSTPSGATWTYTSSTTSKCTVGESDGALTLLEAGTCTITAVPAKTGYAVHAGVEIDLTINLGSQSAPGAYTGTPYGASPTLAVGRTLAVGSVTAPVNAITDGGALEYSVASGTHCRVDKTSGLVTGGSIGNCPIRVRWAAVADKYTASDYSDNIATIDVTQGTLTFATAPVLTYTGELRFADYTTVLVPSLGDTGRDDNNAGVDWNYTAEGFESGGTTAKQNVCTVGADRGRVSTGSAAVVGDICRITVVGSAPGYGDYTSVATVDLTVAQGVQGEISWNPGVSIVKVGQDDGYSTAILNRVDVGESGATVNYDYIGSARCRVYTHRDNGNLEISFLRNGTCVVTATASRDGYRDWVVEHTILVERGDLGTLSFDPIPEFELQLPTLLQGGAINNISVTGNQGSYDNLRIVVQGLDSQGNNKPGLCLVDSVTPLSRTAGVTMVPAKMRMGDRCRVTVIASARGYNDVSKTVTVGIKRGVPYFHPLPAIDFGGRELNLREKTTALTLPTLPAQDEGVPPVAVTWEWESQSTDVCVIQNNTTVKLIDNIPDDKLGATCRIKADGSATNYIFALSVFHSFTVGLLGNVYGSGFVAVNGTLNPSPNPLASPVSGRTLEFQVWDQADSSGGAGSSVCSVNGSGVVTGGAAAGTCYIHARLAAVNSLAASDWFNISGPNGIGVGLLNPPVASNIYSGSVLVNTTLAPTGTLPTSVGEGTLELRVQDGADPDTSSDSTACSVNSSNGRVSAGGSEGTCYIHARSGATNTTAASRWVNISGGGINIEGSTDIYADTLSLSAAADPTGTLPARDGAGAIELRIHNQADPTGSVASTICSVNQTSGRLSAGSGVGKCFVHARFGAQSPYTGSGWFNISGEAGIDVVHTADIYPATLPVTTTVAPTGSLPTSGQGGDLQLRAWNQADPVGGAASTACVVNQENGRVSALTATGTCYIQARFAAAGNYGAVEWFNISGSDGIIIGTWPDIYSDALVVSATMDPLTSLPESDLRGALELRVWNQADTSGGAASSVCTVASDGEVTAGSSAGTCWIQARFGAKGEYSSATDWVNIAGQNGITVVTAPLSQAAPSGVFYPNPVSTDQTIAPNSLPTGVQGAGALEFRVIHTKSVVTGHDDGVTVNQSNGHVRVGLNTANDRFRIEARFQAVPNQYEASEWGDISGEVRVVYGGN